MEDSGFDESNFFFITSVIFTSERNREKKSINGLRLARTREQFDF